MQVRTWAEARQMQYPLPNWEIARFVNSKSFSFHYSTLSQAALIHDEKALREWLIKTEGRKVLKTCFGLSGKGNMLFEGKIASQELLDFCRQEWNQKRPMIAEPWLDRVLDFSTQWYIHPDGNIEEMGATRFETDSKGIYQGTLAGPEHLLFNSFKPFLNEHRIVAKKALKDMLKMGFFGYVGVDALLYRGEDKETLSLYPIVEINARQTMSLVALRLQKKICPELILHLSFEHGDVLEVAALTHSNSGVFRDTNESFPLDVGLPQIPLLPLQLKNGKGKNIKFFKNLYIKILSEW